jgi:hypothetical protein
MSAVTLRLRERWQSATLVDAGWLFLCALLFWASKGAGKLIDGVPGHAGAFWIPPLFLAHGLVRRPGAITMTALLGAACWVFPKGSGAGAVAPYVAAGLVLDLMAGQRERLRWLPMALLAGALCHLAKFLFHNVPAVLLGLSPDFMTLGLLPVAGLHLLFGLLGGLGGWLLLRIRGGRSSSTPEATLCS